MKISLKRIKKISFHIFLVILSLLLIKPAYATIPSDDILDFYDRNGIYYYNPNGNDDYCNSSSTTLAGKDVPEKIWNYFISHGFSDAQTAGILGNAKAETGLNFTIAGSSGYYWGLFQWGGGRRENLFVKMREAGLGKYLDPMYWGYNDESNIPEGDLDRILQVQLDYALSEQDYDWQNEIKKTNSPEAAAEVFLTLFERAVGISWGSPILYYEPFRGILYQAAAERREYALEYYQQYSGKGITTTGSESTAENGANLTIIGDSITVGSHDAILKQFPKISPSDINSEGGRSWQTGVSVLDSMNLKNTVVFALGTNESNLTETTVQNTINKIGPNRNIILVTNYDGTTTYDSNNTIFKNITKTNPNVFVADWAESVSEDPDKYLYPDQIHPTPEGQELFAKLLHETINSNLNANGCSVSGEFTSLVLSYAWPEFHSAPFTDRMPGYAAAVTQSISEGRYVGGSINGVPGIDCGGFVTILVQNSGIAPDYNDTIGGTDNQEIWVNSHNWQLLNKTSGTPIDTSILQPGDVAFFDGHTFIYVGEINGFDSVIASASYGQPTARAPMAGREDLILGRGEYVRWYRAPNHQTSSTLSTKVGG